MYFETWNNLRLVYGNTHMECFWNFSFYPDEIVVYQIILLQNKISNIMISLVIFFLYISLHKHFFKKHPPYLTASHLSIFIAVKNESTGFFSNWKLFDNAFSWEAMHEW